MSRALAASLAAFAVLMLFDEECARVALAKIKDRMK